MATQRRFVAIFDIRAQVCAISIQGEGCGRDSFDKNQIFQVRHPLGACRLSLHVYYSCLCHTKSVLVRVATGCLRTLAHLEHVHYFVSYACSYDDLE
jgi:hypothetical protein